MNSAPLLLFAQNQMNNDAAAAAAAGFFMCYMVFIVLFTLVILVGMWKVFEKAGKPGWASIIPIYNTIVLLEIASKPIWWIFLLFIPCVNIVVGILVLIDLAKNFGQGAGFAVGLWLLPFIFFPILGFGSSKYQPVPGSF